MPIALHNGPIRPLIVRYLAGVNSTALLIECTRLGLIADLILFADAGGERPETVAFLRNFEQWLVDHGQPALTVLRKTHQNAFEGLEQECLRRQILPGLAYGHKSCALKYKTDPMDHFTRGWIRERKLTPPVVVAWSFDAGESRRASGPSMDLATYIPWYPLVEWNWDREQAAKVCAASELHPGESSCFFCPATSRAGIRRLKQSHPSLLDRALALEREAQHTAPAVGLGGARLRWDEEVTRSVLPTREGDPDHRIRVPCECYDGQESFYENV